MLGELQKEVFPNADAAYHRGDSDLPLVLKPGNGHAEKTPQNDSRSATGIPPQGMPRVSAVGGSSSVGAACWDCGYRPQGMRDLSWGQLGAPVDLIGMGWRLGADGGAGSFPS